jgi:hypothetical protein
MEWRKIYAREIEAETVVVVGGNDADTLDGYDSSAFTRKAENATVTGAWTFNDDITMGSGKTVDGVDISAHAARHITSGADEVDGDKLDIDWDPSNYTPATTPSEADSVDNLTAHLYGIDQILGTLGADLTDETFVVMSLSGDLSNERVLTAGDGLDLTDGGAGGNATLAVDVTDFIGSGLTESSNNIDLDWGTPTIGTIEPDDSASAGSSTNPARSDHQHAIVAASAGAIEPDDGVAEGSATSFARSDHQHSIVAAAPSSNLSISTTNAEGSATSFGRSDHSHAITTSANPGAAAAILASDASGRLQLTGFGIGATASGDHLILGDSVQIQWSDVVLSRAAANELQLAAGDMLRVERIEGIAAANLTIAPDGDVIFDPTGDDILPTTGYDLNLGSLQYKYKTLHAAELWVETLVAQNTIATIGGRILVGPTTKLTSDLAPASTTMYVEHNEMTTNDIAYLEADGKVEFILISSTPGGVGPYSYTVVRNADGTGANQWYAGDAVFNTGATGDGFIDLYSLGGVGNSLFDDETGANWGTEYHGLSMANGQAFIDVDNVDLSSWVGTEGSNTPYRIMIKDSSGNGAWGYIGAADAGRTYGSELLSNTGFESFTGTPNDNTTDDFDNWTEVGYGSGDFLDASTVQHGGTYAVEAYYGNDGCHMYQDVTVVAGELYVLSFWTRGDGGVQGRFRVEDQTSVADIIPVVGTGVSGTTYVQKTHYFTAPSGCSTARIYLYSPGLTGSCRFDDVSVKELTDGRVTAVHIVSAVNGSTRNWEGIDSSFDYNDSSYTFEILGPQGGYGPTIVGNVRNSISWNDWSEHWAIGNLENLYGYSGTTYGVALGKYGNSESFVLIDSASGVRMMNRSGGTDYTKSQWKTDGSFWAGDSASTERLEWDSTNGLRIFDNNNNATIQFDISGNADITNVLRMPGASSAIAIGATPPTSSTVGTGIWIDRTGLFALDTNVYQVKIDATDGILYAGGGYTTISVDGIRIEAPTTYAQTRSYQFTDSSGTELGGLYGQDPSGTHAIKLGAEAVTGDDSTLLVFSDSPTDKSASLYLSVADGGTAVVSLSLIQTPSSYTWKAETQGDFEFELEGGGTTEFRIEDASNNPLFLVGDTDGGARIDNGLWVGSVATAPDASDIHYEGQLRSYKNSTSYVNYAYVPITAVKAWDGASNKATATLDLQSSPFSLPANIKAIAVYLGYSPTTSNIGDYASLERASGEGSALVARVTNTSTFADASGIVNCDGSGDIYFTTNDSTNTVYLYIHGYWI